jgi:hypothetical protein
MDNGHEDGIFLGEIWGYLDYHFPQILFVLILYIQRLVWEMPLKFQLENK